MSHTGDEQTPLGMLLQSKTQPYSKKLQNIGLDIGRLYTDKGLPPDMALERLGGYTKLQKLSVLDGVCQWLMEHKRNSGATEKAIERQRNTNKDMIERYVKTGEVGIY